MPTVVADRVEIARRGRRFQYVTIGWNSAECVVALIAGFFAGSGDPARRPFPEQGQSHELM